MAGGRPLKFESPEELQEKIDAYFAECDPHVEWVEVLQHPKVEKDGKMVVDYDAEPELVSFKQMSKQIPYTITGLAIALDTTRDLLIDYEDKEEFSDTIKRAKEKIHNYVELRLFGANPAGIIFNLKNNYGWKDKSEVDQKNSGNITVEVVNFNDSDPSTL